MKAKAIRKLDSNKKKKSRAIGNPYNTMMRVKVSPAWGQMHPSLGTWLDEQIMGRIPIPLAFQRPRLHRAGAL